MKTTILLLTTAISLTASAQKSSGLFLVTDQTKGGYNWSAIRSVSAESSPKLIINNFSAKGTVIDANLLKKNAEFSPAGTNATDQPMYSGVAALAYDQQHDRLYFATMFTQQLRYINLSDNSGNYFQVGNVALNTKTNPSPATIEQQGPVITRMTIGPDNYGYGISNDGNNFFRFSLNNKANIESLGSLVDAEKNGSVSVHNQCSSWGGDMVAAANGDLYLFTMRQLAFKIDPSTRIATYIGKISGLEENFTVNGAAVDENGRVILSTATFAGSRGIIEDMNKLVAAVDKNEEYYNASDLASSNFLFAKSSDPKRPDLVLSKSAGNISVYPNPSVDGYTTLIFEKKVYGKLNIDVLGGSGNTIIRKPVQITAEGQQVRLSTNRLAKGLYVIRVVDAQSKEIYNSKLIVQ